MKWLLILRAHHSHGKYVVGQGGMTIVQRPLYSLPPVRFRYILLFS
jgi:hypothetical protein